MATAKQAGDTRRMGWLKYAIAIAAVMGGAVWFYGEAIAGYSQASTAYAAKYACSCRYLGGRSVAQCSEDLLPGMGALWMSEDEAQASVTATVPLVESTTATYREGYGCVLERWDG